MYEIIVSVPKEWYDKMEDNVRITRCKECKHLLPNDRIAPNWWRICDYWRTGVDENEYCSRGEGKEE